MCSLLSRVTARTSILQQRARHNNNTQYTNTGVWFTMCAFRNGAPLPLSTTPLRSTARETLSAHSQENAHTHPEMGITTDTHREKPTEKAASYNIHIIQNQISWCGRNG